MSADDPFRLRLAVQDRLIDYWWDVDANGARGALAFYTDDCVYDMCGHVMRGPAAVGDYYAFRDARGDRLVRHVLTNLSARVVDAGAVALRGVLTVYAADGLPVLPSAPPILIADNLARFVQCPDGVWRMREHTIAPLFRGGVPVLVPGAHA
ncbi:nuclear transport factor 2 family protein [Ramlibacter sp. AN1015]|uniref:nuclear transport factor 2 family protein n=1 Tax=Ramlibacter sp. AN1015 TaxID=3133428 RepID=UPI0030C428A8